MAAAEIRSFLFTYLLWSDIISDNYRLSDRRAVRTSFSDIVPDSLGRRPNGFLGLSLNDWTLLYPVILLDKTVSVR